MGRDGLGVGCQGDGASITKDRKKGKKVDNRNTYINEFHIDIRRGLCSLLLYLFGLNKRFHSYYSVAGIWQLVRIYSYSFLWPFSFPSFPNNDTSE